MFDNLREDAAASSLYEEEAKFQSAAGTESTGRAKPSRFLGMTAMQRFVITFMLMLAVCIIGAMALLILEKVAI
jgi:hypothetical protein